MTWMIDYGPLIWVILAVLGLIFWGLLGLAGLYAVVRTFMWATSAGRPGAYGLAGLAAMGLAISVVVLFGVYLVVIGALSLILFPS